MCIRAINFLRKRKHKNFLNAVSIYFYNKIFKSLTSSNMLLKKIILSSICSISTTEQSTAITGHDDVDPRNLAKQK